MSGHEQGFESSRRSAQQGFTLLETLVALAIFALAALALLRLEGAGMAGAAQLQDHLVGQIVAHNIVLEAILEANPPALGTIAGTERNGGRFWRWTRRTNLAPEPRLIQIAVEVRDDQGAPAGGLVMYRPGA